MKKDKSPGLATIGFYCLLAAGLIEVLSIIQLDFLNYPEIYIAEEYLLIPCGVFLGAALALKQPGAAWRALLVGLGCVIWFDSIQLLHRVTERAARELEFFTCALLLAYPFPSLTGDGQGRRGLRLVGWLFTGASVLLCLGGLLLKLELLPACLGQSFYWDGTRLHAARHPNVTACILMIAIAFCLGQFFRLREWWKKAGLLLLTAVFFYFMALTNGRTAMMVTSAIISGMFLLNFYRKDWKRILLLLAAAAVLTVGLYTCATTLFYRHEKALAVQFYAHQEPAQPEPTAPAQVTPVQEPVPAPAEDAPPTSGDRSLENQLLHLNGRLPTWKAVFKALRDNPAVLLHGKHYVGEMLSYYRGSHIDHAHNSFLEVTLWLGLPGLLMALYVSLLTIKNSLRILLDPSDMEETCIALLTLGLLLCALLEPILFTGDVEYHFINFVFFLCVGYLEQWGKPLCHE